MSFEFHFHTCHLGNATEGQGNLPNSETSQKPSGESVSLSEREALIDLLTAADAPTPDQNGCYRPHLPDCSKVELFFDGLADHSDFSTGRVKIYGYSKDIARFLYSLAKAGNLVIRPAKEEETAIVTSDLNAQRIASRWPNAVVVTTPGELLAVLKKGADSLPSFRVQAREEMKAKSKKKMSRGYLTLVFSFLIFLGLLLIAGFLFGFKNLNVTEKENIVIPTWLYLLGFLAIASLVIGFLIGSITIAMDKGYTGELGFCLVFALPLTLLIVAFLIGIFIQQEGGRFLIGSVPIPAKYIFLQGLILTPFGYFGLTLLGIFALAILPYKVKLKYVDMFPA